MTDHRYTVIFDVRLECLQASEDGKFRITIPVYAPTAALAAEKLGIALQSACVDQACVDYAEEVNERARLRTEADALKAKLVETERERTMWREKWATLDERIPQDHHDDLRAHNEGAKKLRAEVERIGGLFARASRDLDDIRAVVCSLLSLSAEDLARSPATVHDVVEAVVRVLRLTQRDGGR